jgi:hypothetical protein
MPKHGLTGCLELGQALLYLACAGDGSHQIARHSA